MLRRTTWAVLCLLVLAMGCAARKPGTPPRPGFNLFSKQQDIQLGQEAAAQVRQQYEVVQNPQLQDYISRIGKRLTAQPEAGDYPYTFTLLNDKSVNAFALPGGPAFVFTGLLGAADNEAQLAGVLAHEISHVALRHGTNQASKANLLQLPAMLASAAIGQGSILAQLAQVGLGLGVNSVFLKFSRTDESQADALGARIMAEAGYNPIEMARFFEKLEAEGGSRAPQFLSDHPNPGNRVTAVEEEIRTFPQRNYNYSAGDYQRMKALVAQLPPPSKSPRQASLNPATANPSGGYQELRTQQLSMQYPANWQAFGGQDAAGVTIAPREGLVQNNAGNTALGYGAILSYFSPDSTSKANLKNLTQDLISHLHAGNPSLQVVGSSRKVKVDGQAALLTQLSNDSPFGGRETDWLLTVNRPQGLFYMIVVAPEKHAQQMQAAFDQMLRSLRFAA